MKNFNFKKLLKQIKLNEESISMVLGVLVIVIAGILVVNYFRNKQGKTLPEALTANPPVVTTKSYVVSKGESLWSIAEKTYGSGYNWTDIYKANNLKSESLEIGQKLNLPENISKISTVKEPVKTITGTSYTVVKGDCLWKIAVQAYGDGYQWVKIARENKIVNPNLIHPGNVLILAR